MIQIETGPRLVHMTSLWARPIGKRCRKAGQDHTLMIHHSPIISRKHQADSNGIRNVVIASISPLLSDRHVKINDTESHQRRVSETNGAWRLLPPYIFLLLCSPSHRRGNGCLCLRRRKRTSITGPLRMGAPSQLAALVPAGRCPPALSLPASEPPSSTENRPIVPLPGPKLARFVIMALSRIIL